MNVIVRNMIFSDIEDLSKALAAQGWLMPSTIFEYYYNRMLHQYSDILIAEIKGRPAGFVRIEWVDAGEDAGHELAPEMQEFIVLEKFAGAGVSEAMISETARRVACKTGDTADNALMAIYSDPPLKLFSRCSYVLDGLLVSQDGKFVRAKNNSKMAAGRMISMGRGHKM